MFQLQSDRSKLTQASLQPAESQMAQVAQGEPDHLNGCWAHDKEDQWMCCHPQDRTTPAYVTERRPALESHMSNSSDSEALRPRKKARLGPQSGSLVHSGEQADSQSPLKSQAHQPAVASMVRSAPAQSAVSGAADLHEEHSQAAQHPAVLAQMPSEASTTSISYGQQQGMTWTESAVSSPRALHRLASSGARAEPHPGHEGHTPASHDHSCAAVLQSAARGGRVPGQEGPSLASRHHASAAAPQGAAQMGSKAVHMGERLAPHDHSSAAAPQDTAHGSSSATHVTSLTRHKQVQAAVLNDEETQKGFAGSDRPLRTAMPACPNSGRLRVSESEERHLQAAIYAAEKKVECLATSCCCRRHKLRRCCQASFVGMSWLAPFQHSSVAQAAEDRPVCSACLDRRAPNNAKTATGSDNGAVHHPAKRQGHSAMVSLALDPACMPFPATCYLCSRLTSHFSPAGSG